ncbi:MAG: FeoB-associated Cys-rich membrane protein [Bacteroidetes bacterium]|nr:FeoB-associated Cys-rich membrane protein [Bacteroidota bacterium]
MLQQGLIGILLLASVAFLVRTVYNSFKTGKSCSSGCSKCAVDPDISTK